MQFKSGDVVRFKSETQPMTVRWQSIEYSVPTVCCSFFDDEKKEQIIRTAPDTLELVPPKALKRLQNKKNQTGLKSFFENHPLIIYISTAIVAFAAGFGVPGILQKNANQELLTKGTYILTSELKDTIYKNYVDKNQYEVILNENLDLKTLVAKYSMQKNGDIINQIASLSKNRDRIMNNLTDIRGRNSPLIWPDKNKPMPVSKEEQDALDQIIEINKEISVLYGKMQ